MDGIFSNINELATIYDSSFINLYSFLFQYSNNYINDINTLKELNQRIAILHYVLEKYKLYDISTKLASLFEKIDKIKYINILAILIELAFNKLLHKSNKNEIILQPFQLSFKQDIIYPIEIVHTWHTLLLSQYKKFQKKKKKKKNENIHINNSYKFNITYPTNFDDQVLLALSNHMFISPISMTIKEIIQHSYYVLQAIESPSYIFFNDIFIIPAIYLQFHTIRSLANVMKQFAAIGNQYHYLNQFIKRYKQVETYGIIITSFITAIELFLNWYGKELEQIVHHQFDVQIESADFMDRNQLHDMKLNSNYYSNKHGMKAATKAVKAPVKAVKAEQKLSLLQFLHGTKALRMKLSWIYKFCIQIEPITNGIDLLSILYNELATCDMKNQLIQFLFYYSLKPYFRMIATWIFKGQIWDPYFEFFSQKKKKFFFKNFLKHQKIWIIQSGYMCQILQKKNFFKQIFNQQIPFYPCQNMFEYQKLKQIHENLYQKFQQNFQIFFNIKKKKKNFF